MMKIKLFITATASARFLQDDQASCLEKKTYFFSDGLCQPCGPNQHSDDSGSACISCPDFMKTDGTCFSCQDFTHIDDSQQYCLSDPCLSNYILLKDGTCQKCPDYQTNTSGVCKKPGCFFSIEIMNKDGECEKCPEYSYPSENQMSCIKDECTENQILGIGGRCKSCPQYKYPDVEAKNCVQDVCEKEQYLKEDGRCGQCEQYKYYSQEDNQCVQEQCDVGQNQVLGINGRCKDCEQYYYVQDNQCIQDTCKQATQILLVDGRCQECQYSYPDNNQCVAETCQADQKLKEDGRCEQCPEYTNVDETGKACVEPQCSAFTNILLKSGECKQLLSDVSLSNEQADYQISNNENSIRSTLKLLATPEEFVNLGGTAGFKNKLWSSLQVSASQIQLVSLKEGSVIVTYDLMLIDGTLEQLNNQLTENLAKGKVNVGMGILEASSGQKMIITDGKVVAEGYDPIIITPTSTNSPTSESKTNEQILENLTNMQFFIIVAIGGFLLLTCLIITFTALFCKSDPKSQDFSNIKKPKMKSVVKVQDAQLDYTAIQKIWKPVKYTISVRGKSGEITKAQLNEDDIAYMKQQTQDFLKEKGFEEETISFKADGSYSFKGNGQKVDVTVDDVIKKSINNKSVSISKQFESSVEVDKQPGFKILMTQNSQAQNSNRAPSEKEMPSSPFKPHRSDNLMSPSQVTKSKKRFQAIMQADFTQDTKPQGYGIFCMDTMKGCQRK